MRMQDRIRLQYDGAALCAGEVPSGLRGQLAKHLSGRREDDLRCDRVLRRKEPLRLTPGLLQRSFSPAGNWMRGAQRQRACVDLLPAAVARHDVHGSPRKIEGKNLARVLR